MGDGGNYRDPRGNVPCLYFVRLSVSVSASVLSLCRPSDVEVYLDPASQPGAGEHGVSVLHHPTSAATA